MPAWTGFDVILTLVLSAALNGLANSLRAPVAWAGWLMVLAVPVIVLVLAQVAGEKYRAVQKPVAWFAGRSGVALLFLSVRHCSNSIRRSLDHRLCWRCPWALASTTA